MAEAEDVLTDAARHATVFAQDLWRRHRPVQEGRQPTLADASRRLDLLVSAALGRTFAFRVAQPASPPTWLARWMGRALPHQPRAVPATDGASVWLPARFEQGLADDEAMRLFRLHALRQAMRALRGAAEAAAALPEAGARDVFLLLEARAADLELAQRLPGVAQQLEDLRRAALAARPALRTLPAALRPLEAFAQALMSGDIPLAAAAPAELLERARVHSRGLALPAAFAGGKAPVLWRDAWTGELRRPAPRPATLQPLAADADDDGGSAPPRSARLPRRPEVREADPDEDDDRGPGAWMVQTAQPNEAAEDPMGMQRPTDRDETTASEEFADALSELPEARLVSTPGKPREVLLSEDTPEARSKREAAGPAAGGARRLQYPEWDWRAGAYRDPGATVLLQPPTPGPAEWVERTLAERATMLHEVRRRFELLRAHRLRLRKQLEGDGIDIEAWSEAQADFRAGLPLSQRLYQAERRARRDLAMTLLVDVSGSTDGWIAPERRIIDVEREALLLVCVALEGMADPCSVLAFSGEGPHAVVVRPVKDFGERFGPDVGRRIAGLEPEHYTRAGAALRHATAQLMTQSATHRLLLLLSDGKPNDVDDYEGRYGVEDMRQAVTEARLQGISPFCLTIDRQAANYLPAVFGPHHYALLPRPELLPTVLLDWLRRLVSS
jgi:nitric oxide reductase NorD protein